MAYSDNYPNGYKSGYSSADDPERKDYSPYGEERARREGAATSEERDRRMSEYEAGLEKERQREERISQQYQQEEWEKKERLRKTKEYSDKYVDTIKYISDQKRKEYKEKSFFTKALLALKGKGYHNTNFWDNAKAEVDAMSDKEFDEFYKSNIR